MRFCECVPYHYSLVKGECGVVRMVVVLVVFEIGCIP